MLRRTLRPNPRHALYFPKQLGIRKTDQVIIDGYLTSWRRYDFKHVQLDSFDVLVTYRADKDQPTFLPKTKDGFPCELAALFSVEVGTSPDEMEKATKMYSASDELTKIISREDFVKELLPELRTVVRKSLENIQWLREQIETSEGSRENTDIESIQNAKTVIRIQVEQALITRGFRLKDFPQCALKPIEPDLAERAANPKLEKAWQRFAEEQERIKQIDKKRYDEAETAVEVQRQQLAIDRDRHIAELQAREKEEKAIRDQNREDAELARFKALAKIRQQRIDAEAKDKEEQEKIKMESEQQIRQLQLTVEEKKADEAKKLQSLKHQIDSDSLNHDLINFQEKARIEQQKHALAAEQAIRDSEEKARARQAQLEQDLHELEIAKLQVQLADMNAKLISLKKIEIEKLGEAEAKVAEARDMAMHAHLIHMHDKLLDTLPQVFEKASLTGKSLGEVRVLYMGGSNSSDPNQQSGIGQELRGLISSFSSVSMLREMLRFIGDLPELIDQTGTIRNSTKEAVESDSS
jgi:hypothetical protein